MEWVLILLIYVGAISDKEAVAITSVDGFSSQAECASAGAAASKLTSGTTKSNSFVCVQRKKQ